MARDRRKQWVFLNIPYDRAFEKLSVAYIVGLTHLGVRIKAAISVPNQGRLPAIFRLIETADASIHDLSRVELSRGVPRFNMPVELGIALYRSHMTRGQHRVFIFETKPHRMQRSTSDVNAVDPQIHNGTAAGVMRALRNVFLQPGDVATVPEMLGSYRAVQQRLPKLRHDSGSRSVFEAAIFRDLVLVSLHESQKVIANRPRPTVRYTSHN